MKREFQLQHSDEKNKYWLYEGNSLVLKIHCIDKENLISVYLPNTDSEIIRLVYPGSFVIKEIVDLTYFEGGRYYFSEIEKINILFRGRSKIDVRILGSTHETISLHIGLLSTKFYIDKVNVGKLIRSDHKSLYTLQLEDDIDIFMPDLLFLHSLAFFNYSVFYRRAF